MASKSSQPPKKPAASKQSKPKSIEDFSVSYRTSLSTGDAVMHEAGADCLETPWALRKEGAELSADIRQSRAVKGFSLAKGAKNDGKGPANLVTGEIVQTSPDSEGMRVAFEMVVNALDVRPAQNGSLESRLIEKTLGCIIVRTADEDNLPRSALEEVSMRLAYNLVSGDWLWRNRSLSVGGTIQVHATEYDPVSVEPRNHSLVFEKFKTLNRNVAEGLKPENFQNLPQLFRDNLQILATLIGQTLGSGFDSDGQAKGLTRTLRLRVEAWVEKSPGMRVFPSQLIADSRSYFRIPNGANKGDFGLTREKVGNALRRIDSWHWALPQFVDMPIPVEILGSSLEYNLDFRPLGQGSAFDSWIRMVREALENTAPEATAANLSYLDRCYILAVLVRGGTLSKKAEEDKTGTAAAAADPAADAVAGNDATSEAITGNGDAVDAEPASE